MADVEVKLLTRDITADVMKVVSGKCGGNFALKLSPAKFDVTYKLPKEVADEIENDQIVLNRIFGDVSKHYNAAKSEIIDLCIEAHEKLVRTEAKLGQVATKLGDDIDAVFEKTDKAIEADVTTHIDRHLAQKKIRLRYRLRRAAKAGGITISAGFAVASIVSGVTGNAMGVITGILALSKSFVATMQLVDDLCDEIEKTQKKIKAEVDAIADRFSKISNDAEKNKELKKQEVGAVIVEQFIGYQKASLQRLEGLVDSYFGKLAGMEMKVTDLSNQLVKISQKVTTFDDLISKKEQKQLKDRGYTSKTLPRLMKLSTDLSAKVEKQIGKIEQLNKRIETAMKDEKEFEELLKLAKTLKPSHLGKLKLALSALTGWSYFGFGHFIEMPGAADIAGVVVETVGELKQYTLEKKQPVKI